MEEHDIQFEAKKKVASSGMESDKKAFGREEDHEIHFEAKKKVASSGMESNEKKAFRREEHHEIHFKAKKKVASSGMESDEKKAFGREEHHEIHFEAKKKVASSGLESDEKKAFGKMKKEASPKQAFGKMKKKASPSSASKQVLREECVGMIRKIEALTRTIDLIHLLQSYQSESVSFHYFGFTQHLIWIQELRKQKALVSNNNHVKHEEFQYVQRRINAIKEGIEKEFQDVTRNLVREDSGIYWAFIRQEEYDIMSLDESLTQKSFSREGSANWTFKRQEDDIMKSYEESMTQKTEVGLTPETSGDELLEIAIDSAVRQVSNCIQDVRIPDTGILWAISDARNARKYGIIRKIGISGLGGEKVASALKDMQMVKSKCSVVLRISVSRHHSIEEVRQNIATQTGRLKSGKTDYTSEGSQDQYLPDNFLLLVDCIDGQIDLLT